MPVIEINVFPGGWQLSKKNSDNRPEALALNKEELKDNLRGGSTDVKKSGKEVDPGATHTTPAVDTDPSPDGANAAVEDALLQFHTCVGKSKMAVGESHPDAWAHSEECSAVAKHSKVLPFLKNLHEWYMHGDALAPMPTVTGTQDDERSTSALPTLFVDMDKASVTSTLPYFSSCRIDSTPLSSQKRF